MFRSRLDVAAFDVIAAIATHQWFRKHEPKSVPLLLVVLAIVPSLPAYSLLSLNIYSSALSLAFVYSLFIFSLLTSIGVYRASPFHPLANVPGPFVCKLSKLWAAWIAYGGKAHLYYQKLHQKYGPIVRIGPNEISVAETDFIPSIMGSQGMPKGPMWEGRRVTPAKKQSPQYSLISSRDMTRHAKLRKAWNKAFASGPLKDYEEYLINRANQLGDRLQTLCASEPDGTGHTNISQWCSFFSFDFMGDMAFGGGFELMRDGDKDKVVHHMETSLIMSRVAQQIPWSAGILRSLPFVGSSTRAFGQIAVKHALRRISETAEHRDLFYHLGQMLEPDSEIPSAQLVISNAVLAIIAGSDTTASALSNCLFYLLLHRDCYDRLRAEVDSAFPLKDGKLAVNLQKLQSLEYLNAFINETLRYQPVVPSGLQRSPADRSGGHMIGSMFIPEGSAVLVPPYVLHRDPRYFSPRPDEFWPDRWINEGKDIILDRTAFLPFSYGPANCVGRPLALNELRYVLAMLMHRFDMTFDDGYNPACWEKELEDSFVLTKGELPIKLSVRT